MHLLHRAEERTSDQRRTGMSWRVALVIMRVLRVFLAVLLLPLLILSFWGRSTTIGCLAPLHRPRTRKREVRTTRMLVVRGSPPSACCAAPHEVIITERGWRGGRAPEEARGFGTPSVSGVFGDGETGKGDAPVYRGLFVGLRKSEREALAACLGGRVSRSPEHVASATAAVSIAAPVTPRRRFRTFWHRVIGNVWQRLRVPRRESNGLTATPESCPTGLYTFGSTCSGTCSGSGSQAPGLSTSMAAVVENYLAKDDALFALRDAGQRLTEAGGGHAGKGCRPGVLDMPVESPPGTRDPGVSERQKSPECREAQDRRRLQRIDRNIRKLQRRADKRAPPAAGVFCNQSGEAVAQGGVAETSGAPCQRLSRRIYRTVRDLLRDARRELERQQEGRRASYLVSTATNRWNDRRKQVLSWTPTGDALCREAAPPI